MNATSLLLMEPTIREGYVYFLDKNSITAESCASQVFHEGRTTTTENVRMCAFLIHENMNYFEGKNTKSWFILLRQKTCICFGPTGGRKQSQAVDHIVFQEIVHCNAHSCATTSFYRKNRSNVTNKTGQHSPQRNPTQCSQLIFP